MKINSLLSAAVIACFVTGCATQRQVASSEGLGTRQVYNGTFDQVWRAAIDASQRDGLEVTSSDRATGYISARRTVKVHTFGENVGIWLRGVSPTQTEVEVVSRQAGPPVAWLKNWENEIHRSIAANLTRETPVYGTAPGNTYIERQEPTRETIVVVPQTVPRDNSVIREQRRRLDALRAERDAREESLQYERDSARREAIGRQISILDSDIQLEEQRLRDLRDAR